MKNRLDQPSSKGRVILSLGLTVLCAIVILVAGYAGIIFFGNGVLTNSEEPELVTIQGNFSRLFYSKMEDDIQLYPWNYYVETDTTDENDSGENVEKGGLWNYDPYMEYSIFYTLIAVSAQVEVQEVSAWYESQDKTILQSLTQCYDPELYTTLYFYQDTLRLNARDYQVRMACNEAGIISFSCIPDREQDVRESDQWLANRQEMVSRMEEDPQELQQILDQMYVTYAGMPGYPDWYYYVGLYLDSLLFQLPQEDVTVTRVLDSTEEIGIVIPDDMLDVYKEGLYTYDIPVDSSISEAENILDISEDDNQSFQVIELSDCILLAGERNGMTLGIYYDVIGQRVCGFHFFINRI